MLWMGKTIFKILGLSCSSRRVLFALMLVCCLPGVGESAELEFEIESAHLFRGLVLADDPVALSKIYLSRRMQGCLLGVRSELAQGLRSDEGRDDLGLEGLTGNLFCRGVKSGFGWELGLLYNDFRNTRLEALRDWDSVEFYALIEGRIWLVLVPSLSLYYDLNELNGVYLKAALSAERELWEGFFASAALDLGWGDNSYNRYYFKSGAAFTDLNATLAVRWALNAQLSLRGHLTFSGILDGSLRDHDREGEFLWAGLGCKYEF